MEDDEFEWDDQKAIHNLTDHGVSFEDAKLVFADPLALTFDDDREDYGEDRLATIGVRTHIASLRQLHLSRRSVSSHLSPESRAA